jgi:hypothetical protein
MQAADIWRSQIGRGEQAEGRGEKVRVAALPEQLEREMTQHEAKPYQLRHT